MCSCLPSSCYKYNTFVAFLQKSVANLLWQPLTRPCGSTGCFSVVCSKSGVITDICEMSVPTKVMCMKISAYNSYSHWVFCSVTPSSVGFWGKLSLRGIWGHMELFLFPRAKWVPMIKAGGDGDRYCLYLFFYSPRVLTLLHLVSQR